MTPNQARLQLVLLLLFAWRLQCSSGLEDYLSDGRQSSLGDRFDPPHACSAPEGLHSRRSLDKKAKTNAFLTTIRTDNYLVLLRELHCSLLQHNPTAHLIVASVAGDLSNSTLEVIHGLANVEYLEFEEYAFKNDRNARFSKNWVKLRAWGLQDYNAIIMLDVDGIVRGDLTHLFKLPTDFAWTYEQGPGGFKWNAGAFILLRPCKAILDHMMHLLDTEKSLRFEEADAEQDFIRWYFAHSALQLSSRYNAMYHLYAKGGHKTSGGEAALFIHFGDEEKPFELAEDSPEWRYMCYRKKSDISSS